MRMQISHCLKMFIIMAATKKDKPNLYNFWELITTEFNRVSFPTLILYVMVIFTEFNVCFEKRLSLKCDYLIDALEKTYIAYFIYNDYLIKQKKAEDKK